jgi:hypothetical protein
MRLYYFTSAIVTNSLLGDSSRAQPSAHAVRVSGCNEHCSSRRTSNKNCSSSSSSTSTNSSRGQPSAHAVRLSGCNAHCSSRRTRGHNGDLNIELSVHLSGVMLCVIKTYYIETKRVPPRKWSNTQCLSAALRCGWSCCHRYFGLYKDIIQHCNNKKVTLTRNV